MHRRFSTYAAFASWGGAAFTSVPTAASFVVHFVINPIFLALVIWLAHREGRKT